MPEPRAVAESHFNRDEVQRGVIECDLMTANLYPNVRVHACVRVCVSPGVSVAICLPRQNRHL